MPQDQVDERLNELIEQETDRLIIREEAKDRVRQYRAPRKPLVIGSMNEKLAAESNEDYYLVDKILPQGAYVLCVAQHKTGKTTGMMNLAAALLNGEPFIGYKTEVYDRNVLYLNADMPERLFLSYARNFEWPDGRMLLSTATAREFDVSSEKQMAELTELCLAQDVGVVIMDVWGAIFTGDENDNSEVRQAANKLSALRSDAHLDALIVLHHSGWGDSGRARGASSFEGAVDVIWRLKNSASGPTTFQAEGRIQRTKKVGVKFDPRTWHWSETTAY